MRDAVQDGGSLEAGGEVVVLPRPLPRDNDFRRRNRRSWTLDEKLAIVKEAETSGDPVAVVARRHDMNANHLFTWMDQARRGALGGRRREAEDKSPMDFIDLGVIGGGASGLEPITARAIEIELPSGVRVRFGPRASAEALRQVLTAVKAVL